MLPPEFDLKKLLDAMFWTGVLVGFLALGAIAIVALVLFLMR